MLCVAGGSAQGPSKALAGLGRRIRWAAGPPVRISTRDGLQLRSSGFEGPPAEGLHMGSC